MSEGCDPYGSITGLSSHLSLLQAHTKDLGRFKATLQACKVLNVAVPSKA